MSSKSFDGSRGALSLKRLNLSNFRNYHFATIEIDSNSVIVTGANGAGKTNLLEAISYLVPGRGLRGAKLNELGRLENLSHDETATGISRSCDGWVVNAEVVNDGKVNTIGTSFQEILENSVKDKRVIRINGVNVKAQSELDKYFSALWLTPQMDRLFVDGGSGRRRFVDHFIQGIDSNHSSMVSAYTRSMRNRNKLLKEGPNDESWLSSLENTMARHGVALAARRKEMCAKLGQLSTSKITPFPGAQLTMSGQVERWLDELPALQVEELVEETLGKSRMTDRRSGATSIGPHRSDLIVYHEPSGLEARLCSTGEQKALLIRLVLAASELQLLERGRAPILLLDEVCAHLDEARRNALFEVIKFMGVQAWMTGTEDLFFQPMTGITQRFKVEHSRIKPVI